MQEDSTEITGIEVIDKGIEGDIIKSDAESICHGFSMVGAVPQFCAIETKTNTS